MNFLNNLVVFFFLVTLLWKIRLSKKKWIYIQSFGHIALCMSKIVAEPRLTRAANQGVGKL